MTLCNAVSDAAAERMAKVTLTDPPMVVQPAEAAIRPDERGVVEHAAIGGAIGLFIALAIGTLLFLMNDRITASDDIMTYLGENLLGVVPFDNKIVYKGNLRKSLKRQKRKEKRKNKGR